MILLSSSNLFGGTIDPRVPDSKYIEYGNKHECVVRLYGIQNDDKKFCGSAVLISPKIIITAAHVAKPSKYAYIKYDDKENDVIFFLTPKEYDENKIGGNGFDISIGYLKNEIILDFYPQLYNEKNEIDKVCSLSGFGITGTFDTGAIQSDGKKRGGSNIIEAVEDELLVCSLQNTPNTELEFLISNGDSGGGLFINKKLAGIHSSIYTKNGKLNSGRNNFSLHTRISKHYDWIKQIIEEIKNAESDISRITRNNGK